MVATEADVCDDDDDVVVVVDFWPAAACCLDSHMAARRLLLATMPLASCIMDACCCECCSRLICSRYFSTLRCSICTLNFSWLSSLRSWALDLCASGHMHGWLTSVDADGRSDGSSSIICYSHTHTNTNKNAIICTK